MNEQITMALATVRDAGSLPVTWTSIDECTEEILRWKNTMGLGVIRIGQALLWAKERLPHGEFGDWLRERVEFSKSTAANFMRIAREVEESSSLAQLPYTKVLALLDVPREEREAFAEAHDAQNTSASELRRMARELEAAKADAEQLRIREKQFIETAEAESQRANETLHKLHETREQLENARQALALERRKEPETKVVEKLPDDYVELKQRLAKAEAEADRMADEIDQMKTRQMETEMNGEPDMASRLVSVIGGFLTQAAQIPQRIRDAGDCMDDADVNLILNQIQSVRTWCDALRDALLDQPRLRR